MTVSVHVADRNSRLTLFKTTGWRQVLDFTSTAAQSLSSKP
jgi:hypothetical protein